MAYSSPPCVSIQVDDDSDDVLVRLNCCNGVILLTKDKITEVGKLYEDHRHVVVVPLQILEPPRPKYCEAAQFNCVMMASATPRALLTYKHSAFGTSMTRWSRLALAHRPKRAVTSVVKSSLSMSASAPLCELARSSPSPSDSARGLSFSSRFKAYNFSTYRRLQRRRRRHIYYPYYIHVCTE